MQRNALPAVALALSVALSAVTPSVLADTIKVLTAGAFKEVVVAAVPRFEATTGHRVEVANDTAGALMARIKKDEAFDVVVLTPSALATLGTEGKAVPGTTVVLAKVGIGVAVKQGAPRPQIATTEQFKAAVLAARKVAYIDPAAGGSSGIYLDGLFTRMGIHDAVAPKAVLVPGGLVAAKLVTGDADLAIHQISEILAVKGVDLVGPLPEDIQNYTTYAGAVGTQSAKAAIARAFLAELAGPKSQEVLAEKGMLAGR